MSLSKNEMLLVIALLPAIQFRRSLSAGHVTLKASCITVNNPEV